MVFVIKKHHSHPLCKLQSSKSAQVLGLVPRDKTEHLGQSVKCSPQISVLLLPRKGFVLCVCGFDGCSDGSGSLFFCEHFISCFFVSDGFLHSSEDTSNLATRTQHFYSLQLLPLSSFYGPASLFCAAVGPSRPRLLKDKLQRDMRPPDIRQLVGHLLTFPQRHT